MSAGDGLFVSLRRLGATAVELLHVRLELIVTELEQEKLRLLDALLLAGLALIALGLGALLLALFAVILTPEPYRWVTLGLLTLGCLGGGVWALIGARARLEAPGGFLRASRDELARDMAALNPPAGPGRPS